MLEKQKRIGVLMVILSVAVILGRGRVAECQKMLRVGATLSLTGNTTRVGLGLSVHDGIRFFEKWFESQPDMVVNGESYRLEIDIVDDESQLGSMLGNYTAMVESGDYDYFLGPINSDFSLALREVIDGRGLLVYTAASADGVSVGSQSCYALLAPASNAFSAALRQAQLSGAKSWAYIMEEQAFTVSACSGAVNLAASSGLSTPVQNISVPSSTSGITQELEAIYTAAIDQLATTEQDVVVLCSYSPAAPLMIRRAKEIGFSPKLFLVAPISADYERFDDKEYVAGYNIWSDTLKFPDDGLYGTPKDFSNDFHAQFGYYPDGYAALGAAAPLYLWHAISLAASVSWQDVSYSLSRTDLQTFWGRLYYAANHAALLDPPILQWQPSPINGTIVAPPSGQANPLIYPVPGWSERVQDSGWMVYSGDVVMAVLAGLAIGFSLVMTAVVLVKRDSDVMRAAQPEFVLILLFGSILMYLSIYCWLYYVTDASCKALPWLLATGFSLVFGCLASKTWRVHRLFNNPKLRTVAISRWPILASVVACCGLVWALLIPWSAVDPLTARLVVPDAYRPVYNYYECHVGNTGTGFLITILALEGVLLFVAAAMAFRVRNVKYVLFNEAKFIGFAIYNLIIIGALCVGLVAASLSPTTSFWIRTFCILGAALLTVCCLLLPKIYYLRRGADRRTSSASMTRSAPSATTGSAATVTKSSMSDVDNAYTETEALRNQVSKLQREIQLLQEEVNRLRQN